MIIYFFFFSHVLKKRLFLRELLLLGPENMQIKNDCIV